MKQSGFHSLGYELVICPIFFDWFYGHFLTLGLQKRPSLVINDKEDIEADGLDLGS